MAPKRKRKGQVKHSKRRQRLRLLGIGPTSRKRWGSGDMWNVINVSPQWCRRGKGASEMPGAPIKVEIGGFANVNPTSRRLGGKRQRAEQALMNSAGW